MPDQFAAGFKKQVLQPRINRLLDRHLVSRQHQRPAQQVNRLLTPVRDQDVVRTPLEPGPFQQISAQRFVPARRPELQQRSQPVARQHFAAGFPKFVYRKQPLRRPRSRKIDRAGLRKSGGRRKRPRQNPRPVQRPGIPLRRPAHVTPAPHRTLDPALGFQNFISRRDGGPVQSKFRRQFASRRQSVPRLQVARFDHPLQMSPKLAINRRF